MQSEEIHWCVCVVRGLSEVLSDDWRLARNLRLLLYVVSMSCRRLSGPGRNGEDHLRLSHQDN